MAETWSRQQGEGSPLQSARGTTTINDAVVVSITAQVVQEVSGAEPQIATGRGGGSIPGDNSPTMGELFGRVTGSSRGSRGISVEVGEAQAAVDLTIAVPYGQSIPRVTQAMRDNVIQHVENLTGLQVTEVNITVKDVFFPQQQQ
ncbi:Asp23/Gls24 family envelope stress response protein [soil metagenome]